MGTPSKALRTADGKLLPGAVLNPTGRGKTLKSVREAIAIHGEEIVQRLIDIGLGKEVVLKHTEDGAPYCAAPAIADQLKALELVTAYWLGRPSQQVEVTGEGGGPIQMLGMSVDLSRLGREDFRALRTLVLKSALEERIVDVLELGNGIQSESASSRTIDGDDAPKQ